jgi:hypothetical protein
MPVPEKQQAAISALRTIVNLAKEGTLSFCLSKETAVFAMARS